jgi:PTH1 family peptidyl-tRNA hydrolase
VKRKTPFDWLIVGLGNPGKEYARTRHNVGQEVVAELARRRGDTLKSGRDNALVAESRIGAGEAEQRAVLAFPLTYMNESGQAVRALVRRYGIDDPTRIVVVQDELDLPPTVVRVKNGGGLAGHNGLRSVVAHLGTQDFLRVRIGVGKPPSKDAGAGHVLSRLPAKQRELYDVAVQEAADAVEQIVTEGVDAAMRRYNVRDAGG